MVQSAGSITSDSNDLDIFLLNFLHQLCLLKRDHKGDGMASDTSSEYRAIMSFQFVLPLVQLRELGIRRTRDAREETGGEREDWRDAGGRR